MFNRNWLPITAIGGCLVAAVVLWIWLKPREPDIPRYQGLHEQSADYRAGGTGCDPAELGRLSDGIAANETDRCREATEQHRLQSNDLVQQTRAANATEAAVWLALNQSRVMVLGTIFGFLTLAAAIAAAIYARSAAHAALEAVEEANDATEAAEKAIEVTKDIGMRQLRAYLGIEKIEVDITSEPDGYQIVKPNSNIPVRDFVVIHIKNYGQTPAYKVELASMIYPMMYMGIPAPTKDYDEDLAGKVGDNLTFARHQTLNAGQSEVFKVGIRDARNFWGAVDHTANIYIAGRIFYRDAYGRPWSTKFCYVWEPWHVRGPRFLAHSTFQGEDQKEP